VLTVNGKPSLVIQDAKAYEEMAELVASLRKIQKAAEAFDNGEGRPITDFFKEFEAKNGLKREEI